MPIPATAAKWIQRRIGNNGLEKCCGRESMLRVEDKLVADSELQYVAYRCPVCKHRAGLAINEREAAAFWIEEMA